MTGHHLGTGIEAQLPVIQADEGFTLAGLSQAETGCIHRLAGELFEGIGIKGMQGLSLLQHHHVGDVHNGIHTIDPGPFQTLLHPSRRNLGAVNAFDQRDAVKATGLHGLSTGGRCLQEFMGRLKGQNRKRERRTRQGGHLPGDPDHRQTIRTVGGDRQLENRVIKAEHRSNRRTKGRKLVGQCIEFSDAIGLRRQPQFRQGADHPVAAHPPEFPRFDREIHSRQLRAHHGHRHVQTRPDILGAADDLNRFLGTDIHLTDAEFVGVGMFLPFFDETHDDALGPGAEILNLFLLESRHRQTMGQRVDRVRHLNQLLEPREGDPHEASVDGA